MRQETNRGEDGVVTYEWHVPNWMKKIAVDCGLRDVEHSHADKRRVIACPVSLKAALVFFRFG